MTMGGRRGVRLAFCVTGIYTCFLTWGILQERLTSTIYTGSRSGKTICRRFASTILSC